MEQSRLHIKNTITIILIIILFIYCYFIFIRNNKKENLIFIQEKRCISDGLNVDYKKNEYGLPIFPIEIEIDNNLSFKIEDVKKQSSAIAIKDCNIYVIKGFGFDENKFVALENYSNELWMYNFKGDGKKIIQLNQGFNNGKYDILYKLFFNVDQKEKYISLVQGYLGSDDYALHIKDIETKENVIEVNLTSDLFKKYPNVSGDVEFRGWTEDEKYFWFSLFDQANVLAYIRVNMENGNFEVFEAPVGTMNQDAFNINTGWVTYDDGPPWSGIQEFDQEYQEEWDTENKKVNFYLFNIFTKEQILLDSQSDVTFWHYPKWLDDKTLEYTIPGGEIKKYTLN